MKWLSILAALLMLGACRTAPQRPKPIPRPAAPAAKPKAMIAAAPAPGWTRDIPIKYPADAARFPIWYLDQSLDKTNWAVIAGPFGPPMPAAGSFTVNIGTNTAVFWRMRGVRQQ